MTVRLYRFGITSDFFGEKDSRSSHVIWKYIFKCSENIEAVLECSEWGPEEY